MAINAEAELLTKSYNIEWRHSVTDNFEIMPNSCIFSSELNELFERWYGDIEASAANGGEYAWNTQATNRMRDIALRIAALLAARDAVKDGSRGVVGGIGEPPEGCEPDHVVSFEEIERTEDYVTGIVCTADTCIGATT